MIQYASCLQNGWRMLRIPYFTMIMRLPAQHVTMSSLRYTCMQLHAEQQQPEVQAIHSGHHFGGSHSTSNRLVDTTVPINTPPVATKRVACTHGQTPACWGACSPGGLHLTGSGHFIIVSNNQHSPLLYICSIAITNFLVNTCIGLQMPQHVHVADGKTAFLTLLGQQQHAVFPHPKQSQRTT